MHAYFQCVPTSENKSRIDKFEELLKISYYWKNFMWTRLNHPPLFTLLLVAFVIVSAYPALTEPDQRISSPLSYLQGQPSIPAQFSGDWYSVSGGPNLQISLARSSIYRNGNASLYLTVARST